MREIAINDETSFYLAAGDIIGEEEGLCWPFTALGQFYFSSAALVRTCLGLDLIQKVKPAITLDEMYECSEAANVFLQANAFLRDVLNEATPMLEHYFGHGVQADLDVFTDPDQGTKELIARILTTLGPKEALEILDRFDNGWWFDASPRSDYLLTFALRYIKDAL